MIRRLMLIFGSIVLATVAFLTYLWWASPDSGGPHVDNHMQPTSLQADANNLGTLGPGQGVWMDQYDKDGVLTSRMRAKKYTPRPGGTVVDVVEPQAEFFLAAGRRMVLDGDHGVINVEQRPSSSKSNSGMAGGGEAAPTSGFLYAVVIRVYEAASPNRPTMTLTTNNVSFDNQTFRIATEKFTDSYGQTIAADQVPVTIRGDDIDFDGKGLISRYDDLNKRIAMLQITHGDTMIVKRSDLFGKATPHATTQRSAVTLAPSPGTPGETSASPVESSGSEDSASINKPRANDSLALAAGNSSPGITPAAPFGGAIVRTIVAEKTVATKPPATEPAKPGSTAYRATFLDDVHVFQGDAPLSDGDVLAIDFFPEQGKDKSASTKPTTLPLPPAPVNLTAIANGPLAAPTTSPATRPTATRPSTQAIATTRPSTSPSTQPSPLVIHWKGTLRLIAVENKTVVPLAPGESAIVETGSPLVLHQPQGIVHCAGMLYESKDSSIRLQTSDAIPLVTFDDAAGQTSLKTQHVEYSDATKIAVLTGVSQLHMKQPKQGNQPATELNVTWKELCTAKLFPGPGSAVQQIDLTGDVHVDHPQMKMQSRALTLAFKPNATEPGKSDLSKITATGAVDCDLSAPLTPNRTLKGDKVVVTTIVQPSGNVFPQQLDAAGSVFATEGTQSIASDTLQAILEPKAAALPAARRFTAGPTMAISNATTQPMGGNGAAPLNAGNATTQPMAGNNNAAPLNAGNAVAQPIVGNSDASPLLGSGVADQAELKTFRAGGSVLMISKDGRATADTLAVEQTAGHQTIELRGQPATLTQQGRTITGAVIVAQPDDGLARVDGPGTLHTLQASAANPATPVAPAAPLAPSAPVAPGTPVAPVAPGTPAATKPTSRPTSRPAARPVDLAWQGGANFDGPGNLITFRDQIVIQTVETDGTKRVATSDGMTVTLKPAPATRPARQASPTSQPGAKRLPNAKPAATTNPTSDAFKDKVVSAVTLTGHVQVQSTLESPAGVLIRRTLMQTEKLTANLDDQQQLTNVDIPVPGQALIDDRKATPTTQPASNSGGATAVEWKKSFHLDEGTSPVATLTGDVHIHHDPIAGPGQDSVDLQSSKVIITFAPQAKPPAGKPATRPAVAIKPATKPAGQPNDLAPGVKEIYAAAPVVFKARDLLLYAQTLQFTPASHTVLVSGTERQPAEWLDGDNKAKGQFQQIWYNTETQLVERWTGVSVQGGK